MLAVGAGSDSTVSIALSRDSGEPFDLGESFPVRPPSPTRRVTPPNCHDWVVASLLSLTRRPSCRVERDLIETSRLRALASHSGCERVLGRHPTAAGRLDRCRFAVRTPDGEMKYRKTADGAADVLERVMDK